MKTFKQFMEMVGDFGSKPYKPKINCYGKTVNYKMLPGKKVCARRSGSSAGGDE